MIRYFSSKAQLLEKIRDLTTHEEFVTSLLAKSKRIETSVAMLAENHVAIN